MKRYNQNHIIDHGTGAPRICDMKENSKGRWAEHSDVAELEQFTRELCESVILSFSQSNGYCVQCGRWLRGEDDPDYRHRDDCIVLKAENWLKEKRDNE